jgi:hypothetical protein
MSAGAGSTIRQGRRLAMQVEPIRLSVGGPSLLQRSYVLTRGNTIPAKCDDGGPNAHVGFGSGADMATTPTSNYWRPDLSVGADLMQHRIQNVAQSNYLRKR